MGSGPNLEHTAPWNDASYAPPSRRQLRRYLAVGSAAIIASIAVFLVANRNPEPARAQTAAEDLLATASWWLDATAPDSLFTDGGCSTASTTDGDAVGCWVGRNGNAVVTDGSALPLVSSNPIGGLESISFAGNSRLVGPDILGGSLEDMQMFVVARTDRTSQPFSVSLNGAEVSPADRFSVHIPWSDQVVYWDAGGIPTNRSQILGPPLGDEILVNGWKDSADGRNGLQLLNGDEAFSPDFTPATTAGGMRMGQGLTGDMAEIIVFNRRLDPKEELLVTDYLLEKYNIDFPSLVLEKTGETIDADGNGTINAGDQVQYSFTVRNVGDFDLSELVVTDPVLGTVTCSATTIPVGDFVTCSAPNYMLSQTDIDNGQVENNATATALGSDRIRITDLSDDPNDLTNLDSDFDGEPDDPTIVTFDQQAGLSLDKTAGIPTDANNSGLTDAGDTIAYTFTVVNTGNVTVDALQITDPNLISITCDVTTLAPGATASCSSDTPYTVVETDETAGGVTNAATATATDPNGAQVTSNADNAFTAVQTPNPQLQVTVSAGTPTDTNGDGITDAGDTVDYSYTVTNTGNVPVDSVTINDSVNGAVTCLSTSLDVGASTTCTSTVSYTVTTTDEAAGQAVNTVNASANDPDGTIVTSNETSAITPVTAPNPVLVLTAVDEVPTDVNGSGITDAGDTIAYTFTVTNSGNVPVDSLTVDGSLTGAASCASTTLAPGETTTCTSVAYTVSETDETAGEITNNVTASGLDSNDATVTANTVAVTTAIANPRPQLHIEKTAGTPVDGNGSGLTDAGDTVAYTFTVTNTGNVPLGSVAVSDPIVGTVTCDAETLAVDAFTTCTAAPYTITEADEANGFVLNTATATATDPDGNAVEPDTDDAVVGVRTPAPALTLEKVAGTPVDANSSGITDAGDTIGYTFTVTNSGNVPITSVTVSDTPLGAVSCEQTSLAAGASTSCTAGPYTVTDTDEAAGFVLNTATVSGVDPDGGVVTSAEATAVVGATAPNPELTVVKTASAPTDANNNGITDAGDSISYSFAVTNTGNVPIASVGIDDPLVGAVTCTATTLQPDESTTCTSDSPYTVTAADEAAGQVTNTAAATGFDPDGTPITSPTDDAIVGAKAAQVSIDLDKIAGTPNDVDGDGLVNAGDTIAYTFTVTNTGNVPLSGLSVTDDIVGTVTCPTTDLAVGEAVTCDASIYTITAADEDAGAVVNNATAAAVDATGTTANATDTTTTVARGAAPSLTLEKTADAPVDENSSGLTDAGDTIGYHFTVTNDGNLTIDNLLVVDALAGPSTCAATTLAPGESTTCDANSAYEITAADEEAGLVINSATATGTDAGGRSVTSSAASSSTAVRDPQASLAIIKTADAPVDTNGSGINDAGDTVQYRFTVKNAGTVPLTSITVTDSLVGAVTCDATELAAGASTACIAASTYEVTSADEAAGSIVNTATASGTDPDGQTVESEADTTTVPLGDPLSVVTLVKTAGAPVDVNASGLVDAGDTVAYSFTVINAGNVPVDGVVVSDPLLGTITCAATTLGPGATTTCSPAADYTITAADQDAGSVINTATATANDPDGNAVTASTATVTTPTDTPLPVLSLTKTAAVPVDANSTGLVDAGDTIAYTFTVTNAGNVPVSAVTINDPLVGTVTCDPTTLAPQATTNCTADALYTIDADDEAAGVVVNSATASATDPDNATVTSPTATTFSLVSAPAASLSMDKTADAPVDENSSGLTDAGDTISYSFAITNDGNVTIGSIGVSDDKVTNIACAATELAPGESTTCSGDAYTITADDEAAGIVVNTATATGTDPLANAVTSPEDMAITVVRRANAAVSLVKTAEDPVDANSSGLVDAGDTIQFRFTVVNSGNVPLTDVVVADPTAGIVSCDATSLAVGETTTCAADAVYTITADNVTDGSVINTATVAAMDPDGVIVEATDTVTVPTDSNLARLSMTKTADAPVDANSSGATDAGDTISYTFSVTNIGNVPVTDLAITDPKAGSVTCAATTLAPDATTDCVTDNPYTISADDQAANAVINTATATATDPDGNQVESVDTVTVAVTPPVPSIVLVKTANTPVDANASGVVDAGDTVTYRFSVTNTGNVPVSSLLITDPVAGAVTCEATDLGVGASTACVADNMVVITDAHVAAGAVENTATATAQAPDGSSVESSDTLFVPTGVSDPELTITKTADAPVDVNASGITDVGDTIQYRFVVANSGNVPITSIAVTDAKVGTVTCEATELAPDATTNCLADATYAITDADASLTGVVNQATAGGIDPDGDPVTSAPATVTVPISAPFPALVVSITNDPPVDVNNSGITDAGDTVVYRFEVTNTGNVPLTNIVLTDDSGANVTCVVTELGVGESTTCVTDTAYEITDADAEAGVVINNVTATGQSPDGVAVTSVDDTNVIVVEELTSALSVIKTAAVPVDVNSSGLVDEGDTVAYTFTVVNNGNVSIFNVAIDDAVVGTVTCEATTLVPGASTTCTPETVYTISADDESAGAVVNTATARGVDPDGTTASAAPSTVTTPTDSPLPVLTLTKTAEAPVDANNTGVVDAGDTIAYSFSVTNVGNVPVTDPTVNDPLVGAVTCDATTLDPQATTTCTSDSSYTIDADDETEGVVVNSATASATDPDGGMVASPKASAFTLVSMTNGSLSVVKSADPPSDLNGSGLVDAGDTIQYRFTITNDGNVTVSSVAVVDDKVATVACDATELAPGASTECVASLYTVTGEDETSGVIVNTASATGVDPLGDPVSSPDDLSVVAVTQPQPGVALVKTADDPVDTNSSGLVDAGDTVQFRFVVVNSGNVPLTDVAIADPMIGDVTCDATSLAVGASTDCQAVATYGLTDADVTNGAAENTATVTALTPDEATVEDTASVTVPTDTPLPLLSMTKTAGTPVDANSSGLVDAGDTISYTFSVTNEGNVPVAGVAITDTKVGVVTCTATTLAPGASTDCVSSSAYTITAADQAASAVINTATATATDPDGDPVSPVTDTAVSPVTVPFPSLVISKTADPVVDANASAIVDAGDTILYRFAVFNTGNVPLSSVAIGDPTAGAVTCETTDLAVGASTNCVADAAYTITVADETAGFVTNEATATAVTPDQVTVTSIADSITTPVVAPNAGLVIAKKAEAPVDTNASNTVDAGDTIAYSFVVVNSGNVTLDSLSVVDVLTTAVSCDATQLAPGASTDCAATSPYTITDADAANGFVTNTATASATDPSDNQVTSSNDSTTTAVAVPAAGLSITKSADTPVDANQSGLVDAGDRVVYRFVVTNQGNVTLSSIAVSDPKAGAVTCDDTELAPGASTNCETDAAYTITTDDEIAGAVINEASVSAMTSDGASVTSPLTKEAVGVRTPSPGVSLVKTSATTGPVLPAAGETIAYRFTVTNTGNVPVDNISITDDNLSGVTCDATRLEPGIATDCVGDAPYTVTDADVVTGVVTNTATVTATAPNEAAVSATDSIQTPVQNQSSTLFLVKTADAPVDNNGSGLTDAGDGIRYRFVVVNGGNVVIDNIAISDEQITAASCERTELAPGERTECVADADYIITDADAEAGEIVNTATATGLDPSDVAVESAADTTTTTANVALPVLELAKSADDAVDVNGTGSVDPGDTIQYRFVVTNSGNTNLSGVTIEDLKVGPVTCTTTELAPGAATDCRADDVYTVTFADGEAGQVTNAATATATGPSGVNVSSQEAKVLSVVNRGTAVLSLNKVGDPFDLNGDGLINPGDTIRYTYTVTNTGTVALSGLTIDDPLVGSVTCLHDDLEPGESITCIADSPYVITAEDGANGAVANTATAGAADPNGVAVSSNASEVVIPVQEGSGLEPTPTAEPTVEPTEVPATATPAPTATTEPTVGPTEVPSTATPAPTATGEPTVGPTEVPATATPVPSTGTPVPTATPATTVDPGDPADPTATEVPVTLDPTATVTPTPSVFVSFPTSVPTATSQAATPGPGGQATSTPGPTGGDPQPTSTPGSTGGGIALTGRNVAPGLVAATALVLVGFGFVGTSRVMQSRRRRG